jgi:hypothetical protein
MKLIVAVTAPTEFEAITVAGKGPTEVGVPETTPELELIVSPGGNPVAVYPVAPVATIW